MTNPEPVENPDRIIGIRRRDPAALEAVVKESLPLLLRVARAAGLSADRADDAVQDTFLTFFERAHQFDGRAKARTWLYGILRNKIAKVFESSRRFDDSVDVDSLVNQRFDATGRWIRPPRGPDSGLDRTRLRRWFAECLDQLPPQRRLAFVLREVEELPTDEICAALDVSANNLGVLFFRARNGLRECLEAKGIAGRADTDL